MQSAPDQGDRALHLRHPADGQPALLPELREKVTPADRNSCKKSSSRCQPVMGRRQGSFPLGLSAQGHIAGGQAAHQGVHAVFHLDAVHSPAGRQSGHWPRLSSMKMHSLAFRPYWSQQTFVDAGVRFVDVHMAGGDPLRQRPLPGPAAHQKVQGVLGNVAEIV